MSNYSHSLRLARQIVFLVFSGSCVLSAFSVWNTWKVGHHLLAGSSDGTGCYIYVSGTVYVFDMDPTPLIYGVSVGPSGIPEHFPAPKSDNTAMLTMPGLQSEDEADHYCCSHIRSDTLYTVVPAHGTVGTKLALCSPLPSCSEDASTAFIHNGLEQHCRCLSHHGTQTISLAYSFGTVTVSSFPVCQSPRICNSFQLFNCSHGEKRACMHRAILPFSGASPL